MPNAKIIGTGSYVPEKVITSEKLEQQLGLPDGWILKRTGISERRWSQEHETMKYMMTEAADRALKAAGTDDFDSILVGRGRNPDFDSLTLAGAVHAGLKEKGYALQNVDYIDGFYICSGSVAALYDAVLRIGAGDIKKALVLGSSRSSKYCNKENQETACLWADGAGAIVVAAAETPGFLKYKGKGISEGWNWFPAKSTPTGLYVEMQGQKVYRAVIENTPEVVQQTCLEAGVSVREIDWFILHQANQRLIEGIMAKLEQPLEKCPQTIQKYGNTSAASVLITYDELRRQGKVKAPDLCAFIGYGAGMHINCLLYRE